MSISSELKDLARRIEEMERQASKYRNGELKIDLTHLPAEEKAKLYPQPGELVDQVTLVMDFVPTQFESSLSTYDFIKESVSGYLRLKRVEK